MIKRINTLKHIGRFTELTSARGDDGDFAELNVIFASNASGKSTLCDVFRSMSTGNGAYVLGRRRLGAVEGPEIIVALAGPNLPVTIRFQNDVWHNHEAAPLIHIYDDRFVAENVLVGHHINVDQRRNLYGLVIGEQAVALKQAVDTAEQNLSNATNTHNTTREALIRLLPEDQTIDSFRNIAEIPDVDQEIATATQNLDAEIQTHSKADAICQRSFLSPVLIAVIPADLPQVLKSTLDDVALAAERRVREHLAATSEGLTTDWLGQGHRAQTGTNCPHCGQDMTGLDILQAYRAFFSGELQDMERTRSATKTYSDHTFGDVALNQLKQELVAHETERTWWEDAAGHRFELPVLRDQETVLVALKSAHGAIISALVRKQANPGAAITLTAEEAEALQDWNVVVAELTAYNEGLATINATLIQRKADAGTVDLAPFQTHLTGLKASKKRHEQPIIDAYTAFDDASRAKVGAQNAKREANDALREQSNQLLTNYGARINELLARFSVDFRIVPGGVNFRGGQPSGDLAVEILGTQVSTSPIDAANPALPSLANTLSGGDRSALALAYFLATVEQDTGLADSVVVFDDPYHNQDRSRRQFTLEKIAAVAQRARQCFVLSHDLEFARAVETRPRTFVLKPLGDQVTLEPKPLPLLPSRAYEKNYLHLSSFLEVPQDHLDHLKEIADTLRVILEEYFRLKFPARWGENDWLGDMIGKIRDAEQGDPLFNCEGLVDELSAINTYSKRFHHAAAGEQADEPDPRELKTYVERTLSVIHN